MKNILTLMLLGVVFIGCTHKVQTDIAPYVTLHQNEVQDKKINFVGVEDQRDTKIVSTIINNGSKSNQYPLNVDLKVWYTEAFIREFKNTQMLDEQKSSDIDVKIIIKKIDAIYKNETFNAKNMTANIQMELIVIKGKTTIRSIIEINQSVYKPVVYDAEGFESIINESMQESVSKTIEILIKKMKDK